mmetsp:Transcript_2478/g.8832  ORF Transcript_2478/g.8832 Transcript_2478/m.8832 type:complete len:329 (-) Transcript_2478:331-1317(-)
MNRAVTLVPASRAPSRCGSSSSALALRMDRRRLEAWLPVLTARRPPVSASHQTEALWYSGRSGSRRRRCSTTTVARTCSRCFRPDIALRAGTAKRMVVTMQETGLPGVAKKRALPASFAAVPNVRGLPGFISTLPKCNSLFASSQLFTRSTSPMETPPDVRTKSVSAKALVMAASVPAMSSLAMPRSTPSHIPPPNSWSSASNMGRLLSQIFPCCSARLRSAPLVSSSSSPVDITATRTGLCVHTRCTPTEARRPTSAAPRRTPFCRTVVPGTRSEPTGRMSWPTLGTARRRRTLASLPSSLRRSSSVHSTITTALQLGGTGAPVMIW